MTFTNAMPEQGKKDRQMDFRTELKPHALRCKTFGKAAYRAVLRLKGEVVWHGPHHLLKDTYAEEAKQRALEDAEYVLHCDDGSLMAEELAGLVG
jgi:hypothetical protein